ncbi:hypothetical protein V8C86DRAFT_470723 [Haematococcus lacustris]
MLKNAQEWYAQEWYAQEWYAQECPKVALSAVAVCSELLEHVRRSPLRLADAPDKLPKHYSSAAGRAGQRRPHPAPDALYQQAQRLVLFPGCADTELLPCSGVVLHAGSQYWAAVLAVLRQCLHECPDVCLQTVIQKGGQPVLQVSWLSQADARIAASAGRLLRMWFSAATLAPELQPFGLPQLIATDISQRAHATASLQHLVDSASETPALMRHVIGPGPGQPGAAGLAYVHDLQWQPYHPNLPGSQGSIQAILTDGRGVFMAVVVKELWLVRLPRRNLSKTARSEAKRRERRKAAIQAALRSAACFRAQLPPLPGGVTVVVLAAVCCSHAEGLEVVSNRAGVVAKQHEAGLAQALIHGLVLGPGCMELEGLEGKQSSADAGAGLGRRHTAELGAGVGESGACQGLRGWLGGLWGSGSGFNRDGAGRQQAWVRRLSQLPGSHLAKAQKSVEQSSDHGSRKLGSQARSGSVEGRSWWSSHWDALPMWGDLDLAADSSGMGMLVGLGLVAASVALLVSLHRVRIVGGASTSTVRPV